MAWDAWTSHWADLCDAGVPRTYVCTHPSNLLAGMTHDIAIEYMFDLYQTSDGTCHHIWPQSATSRGVRTPSCPAGYSLVDNNGPCYRVKPEGCKVGNPIQCAGGDKVQSETDFSSTSSPGFTRYYSSTGFYTSPGVERPYEILGPKWRHSWQSSVVVEEAPPSGGDRYAYVTRPDGDYRHFRWDGSAWVGRADKGDTLTEITSGGVRTGWTFKASDDSIYRYGADGDWLSWERDGLVTTLTYSDASSDVAPRPGLLVQVTDARGRFLRFVYDTDGYIAQVSDSSGASIGYRFVMNPSTLPGLHNTGLLQFVDFPGGVSREYRYDESAHVASGAPVHQLLTGIIDENGQPFATFEYNVNGRAVKEWHGSHGADLLSMEYQSSYNGASSSTLVVDPLGQTIRRKYVAVAGVVRDAGVDLCSDATCTTVKASSSKTYDVASGNPDLDTDFKGNVTDHDYDTRGRETKRVEASTDASAKRTTETDWNTNFNVPDQRTISNSTNTLESKTKWSYNSRGQATMRCELDPQDATAEAYACNNPAATVTGSKIRQWVMTYCEASDVTAGTCPLVGLVTAVNGPRLTTDAGMGGGDDITTYTYRMADDPTCASNGACTYRKGDLWKVTNALGQVTEYVSYDKNGRAKRMKDANGTYTDVTYNARGWLTDRSVRANASGTPGVGDATLHIDYDAVGNVTQVTQPDGAYLQYTYDDAHRLLKIKDNLSNSIDYCPTGLGTADCLDAAGNRRAEATLENDTGPGTGTVRRQLYRVFNQLGQLTEVQNHAHAAIETSTGLNSSHVVDGYDDNGNRVRQNDGLNVRTEQEYDPLNRLKKTIQDALGSDPGTASATTLYAYDTRDNLTQVTDPDLLNTVYTYDGLNNLTALDSPDTGHTGYAYDAAGNRISQTDNRSVTSTYTYDRLNRLTAIAYPTTSLNVTYAYDQPDATTGCSGSYPQGRLTRMTDVTGSTTYCYDRRGNVTKKTQVTNGTTLVTEYSYTVADRLSIMNYPSGAWASYTRDAVGRISYATWGANIGAKGVVLINSATYLPFGPLKTLTFGNGRTLTKNYDLDYAINSISGTPAGAFTLDIVEVDVMGNIKKVSGTMNPTTPDRAYGYDALYRLTTSQTGATPPSPLESYTYNKTGDRQSASLNGGPASTYLYTDAGTHHLTSVGGVARTYDNNGNTLTGTSTGLTLTYDDRNRLASMVNGSTSATYGITGRGERVRKTVTVSGTPTTTLFGYDEGGHLAGEYSGAGVVQAEYIYLDSTPVGVFKGGTLYYIETDHLGTPRQVVKPATNTVVWNWDFLQNTFGNSAPNQDPDGDSVQFVLGMRFPGQYFDVETGLDYNYLRDYDSHVGRYLESDPIGLAGGIHTYAYALGNPIALMDQMGLQQQSVPICRALKPGETANTPPGNSGHLKCDDEVPGFTLKNYRTYGCSKLKECAEIHETRHKDDCGTDACKGNQGKDITMIFLTSSDHMTSENNAFNDELACLVPNPYNHATDANCYNVCEDRAKDIKKRLLPCVARGDYNHTPDCMDQRPAK